MPDAIERNLQDIADRLLEAWRVHQCVTCPLAELAALAQATVTFYQEQQQQTKTSETEHWSAHWHRDSEDWK